MSIDSKLIGTTCEKCYFAKDVVVGVYHSITCSDCAHRIDRNLTNNFLFDMMQDESYRKHLGIGDKSGTKYDF